MHTEAIAPPNVGVSVDHTSPFWASMIAKAIHCIPFIEQQENNLHCARAMQVGAPYTPFALPVPNNNEPSLEVSLERIHKPEAPHIDEPSIVLRWQTARKDDDIQIHTVAVGIARIIVGQVELQNIFNMDEYRAVVHALDQQ